MRAFIDRDSRRRLVRYALGRPISLETIDRRILEHVILPYYDAQPDIQTVLFVEVACYTRHYDRSYFPRKDYWTVDSSRAARRYGASGTHRSAGGNPARKILDRALRSDSQSRTMAARVK